jgi:SAM-dependent methyltransferase
MFKEYAQIYDLCNSDKNYTDEVEYIHQLIHERRPRAKTLLDLGSGTGSHVHLLAQKGYQILGVELSQDMADIANRKFPNLTQRAEVVRADMRTFHVDRHFDVVTSLFHVMSYQTTNDDFVSALNTARKHLKPGGLFIFDFWYGPAVLADRPHVRVKRLEKEGVKVTRIAEPDHDINENIVRVNYTLQVLEAASGAYRENHECHTMRYFFLPEIRPMLREAGFKVLDCHGWLDRAPISEKTWGPCVIAEAF